VQTGEHADPDGNAGLQHDIPITFAEEEDMNTNGDKAKMMKVLLTTMKVG